MQVYNIKDFKGGWFIGDFNPNVLHTTDFEIGYNFHPSGSYWAPHIHKIATEYTFLLEGKMEIGGQIINQGEIFVIDPYEVAEPKFLEDCKVIIIKTPSIPGDKYLC